MKSCDELRIEIIPSGIDPDQFREEMANYCSESIVNFELPSVPGESFRTLETTALIAIVGASGAALGSFITGLFSLAKQKRAERIRIRDGNTVIDCPVSLLDDKGTDKLAKLLEKIREMKRPRIKL